MDEKDNVTEQLKELMEAYDFNVDTLARYLGLPADKVKILSRGDISFLPDDNMYRFSNCSIGTFASGFFGISFVRREFVTAVREKISPSASSSVSSPSCRMPSAKPSSTAFFALNHDSASMRCEILLRDRKSVV